MAQQHATKSIADLYFSASSTPETDPTDRLPIMAATDVNPSTSLLSTDNEADESITARGEKVRQLSTRACDACRARRRKCVFPRDGAETASHCVGCSRLHIQCSFDIPTRPRGPKRRR
ncbi:hypothetical protein HZ326_6737 [Fusarium oxysporum f. sp. albedinis]|nr:hypothetical protein HZ326_6737 [Fusarium oxysporum f. sp. albedinis]